MSAEERKYAMTKLRAGDYICPSNDGRALWRFQRYQDGRFAGLDVGYEARMFWRASRADMPPMDQYFDVDYLEWVEWATMLPSRGSAVRVMVDAGLS